MYIWYLIIDALKDEDIVKKDNTSCWIARRIEKLKDEKLLFIVSYIPVQALLQELESFTALQAFISYR